MCEIEKSKEFRSDSQKNVYFMYVVHCYLYNRKHHVELIHTTLCFPFFLTNQYIRNSLTRKSPSVLLPIISVTYR